MAKDSLELILDGGGVMDQMIPIDGSWEGNSSEVTEHYRAIHEEANLNQELLQEKEQYMRQQEQMGDGE